MKVTRDIVFKQVGETKLGLLLFHPLEKAFEKSPLVVYFHGGGWGARNSKRLARTPMAWR